MRGYFLKGTSFISFLLYTIWVSASAGTLLELEEPLSDAFTISYWVHLKDASVSVASISLDHESILQINHKRSEEHGEWETILTTQSATINIYDDSCSDNEWNFIMLTFSGSEIVQQIYSLTTEKISQTAPQILEPLLQIPSNVIEVSGINNSNQTREFSILPGTLITTEENNILPCLISFGYNSEKCLLCRDRTYQLSNYTCFPSFSFAPLSDQINESNVILNNNNQRHLATTGVACRYRSDLNDLNQCICDNGFYFDSVLANCQLCGMLCETCIKKDKCGSCNGNRMLSGTGVCLCPDGFYGKKDLLLCEPCHKTCKTCFGQTADQCLSCYNDDQIRLRNGKCICPNKNYIFNEIKNQCVRLNSYNITMFYDVDIMPVISLNFTNALQTSTWNVLAAFRVDIIGLQQDVDYTISIHSETSSKKEYKINLLYSMRQTSLIITLMNSATIIDGYNTPLNQKYMGIPNAFHIYPHHAVNDEQLAYLQKHRQFSSSVYFREGFGADSIWTAQLLNLQNVLWNSLQPTSMLLLYNQYLPINVWETLRAYSIFQFQKVGVWGEEQYQETQILRKHVTAITDNQDPTSNVGRVGMSSSFFANFFRLGFLYGIAWLILYLARLRFLNDKYLSSDKKQQWVETLYEICIYAIAKITEGSFLTITLMIFLQMRDPSFANAFDGISYFINFIYLAAVCGAFYFFISLLKEADVTSIESKNQACKSLGSFLLDLQLTESMLVKYYHIFTFGKKLLCTFVIVFLPTLEEKQVIAIMAVEGIYFIYLVAIRPYTNLFVNIVRMLISLLYFSILGFTFHFGIMWKDMASSTTTILIDELIIGQYYEEGTTYLWLVLAYNIVNLVLSAGLFIEHFYSAYQLSHNEHLREMAYKDLKQRRLENYQELVDMNIVGQHDSIMRVINLEDNRKIAPLQLSLIEVEIVSNKPPNSASEMLKVLLVQQKNQQQGKAKNIFTVSLRKDLISKNYVDPINRIYTISIETVAALGANKSSKPIFNEIETNVNVDYSNIQKTVFHQGTEEFRVFSKLLYDWKISKIYKLQREETLDFNIDDYQLGEAFDLTTQKPVVTYSLIQKKLNQKY